MNSKETPATSASEQDQKAKPPGKNPSAASMAFYRVLIILLLVGTLTAAMFVFQAAIQKREGQRGPRSLAEKNILDAEAAARKNPSSAKARVDLGRAYGVVGRYKDASRQLSLAEKIDPDMAEIPYLLGAASRQLNDYSSAVKYLKKAGAREDELAEFYSRVNFELGQTYYDNRQFKEAVKAFEVALKNAPMASDIMHEIGRSYEGLRNKKEAIAWHEDALVYDPSFEEAREALIRLGVDRKDLPSIEPGGEF